MKAVDPAKLCILVTVYPPYRWCAPVMAELLDTFWPLHPPVFFCGLSDEDAAFCRGRWLRLPRSGALWAESSLHAVRHLAAEGFDLVYFLGEDHLPLAPCHERHLNRTIPALMSDLPASYIGLLGWDNRRFAVKGGPVLPKSSHRLMHLSTRSAPRFHLHPSLFRTTTLVACLEAVCHAGCPTPREFEKVCDRADAPLSPEEKQSCYQICGAEFAADRPAVHRRLARCARNFFFHRAMAVVPLLRQWGIDMSFWDFVGFDNFFYEGPYPMFYSGAMSRGRVNPFFRSFVQADSSDSLRGLRRELGLGAAK